MDTAAARSDRPVFSSLFFSGPKKQRQTRQQPYVPALGKCYNLQSQLFMTPVHVHFGAVKSHIHLHLMMLPFVKSLLVCIYLLNASTTVQEQ